KFIEMASRTGSELALSVTNEFRDRALESSSNSTMNSTKNRPAMPFKNAILRGPLSPNDLKSSQINKIRSPFFGITLKSSQILSFSQIQPSNFYRIRGSSGTIDPAKRKPSHAIEARLGTWHCSESTPRRKV